MRPRIAAPLCGVARGSALGVSECLTSLNPGQAAPESHVIYALKLLFYVLAVGLPAAWLMRPAFKGLLTEAQYKLACQTLFVATLVAFLSKTPGLFMVAVGLVAFFAAPRLAPGAPGALAVFALLLITMPSISASVGGVGSINQILTLNPLRVLALAVLLPAAVRLMTQAQPGGKREPGFLAFDLAVLAFPLLRVVLAAPYYSNSTVLRLLVEMFADTWLPYFVISRGLRSVADVRFVLAHLALGCGFVAAMAVAESVFDKQLYSGLQYVYDTRWQLTTTLMRGDRLRVQATLPQPIALAFVMMIALGLWVWLRGRDWRQKQVAMIFVLLAWALVATWSRGPWLGAASLALSLFALYRMPARAYGLALLVLLALATAVKVAGADDAVMDAFSRVFGSGAADMATIEYRRILLDTSLALVKQSPWWGVPNYQDYMEHLRQGEGIIDVVNSYMVAALEAGLVGLVFFVLPYLWVLVRLLAALSPSARQPSVAADTSFEKTFAALLPAALLTIFTTSTTNVMACLMLMLAALPWAWLTIKQHEELVAESAGPSAGHAGLQPWRPR